MKSTIQIISVIAVLISFVVLMFWLAHQQIEGTEEYLRRCQEAGGVPISFNGGDRNCVKEGFIDLSNNK